MRGAERQSRMNAHRREEIGIRSAKNRCGRSAGEEPRCIDPGPLHGISLDDLSRHND
jgi:hypothetical protein